MKINLLVTGGHYDSIAGYQAWQFCRAAHSIGHKITQVFFYQAGATHGTNLAEPLADEFDAPSRWAALASEASIPLVVCVSAAERRGIIGHDQQLELGKPTSNLAAEFVVEGLASFYAACLSADRTVTFR